MLTYSWEEMTVIGGVDIYGEGSASIRHPMVRAPDGRVYFPRKIDTEVFSPNMADSVPEEDQRNVFTPTPEWKAQRGHMVAVASQEFLDACKTMGFIDPVPWTKNKEGRFVAYLEFEKWLAWKSDCADWMLIWTWNELLAGRWNRRLAWCAFYVADGPGTLRFAMILCNAARFEKDPDKARELAFQVIEYEPTMERDKLVEYKREFNEVSALAGLAFQP